MEGKHVPVGGFNSEEVREVLRKKVVEVLGGGGSTGPFLFLSSFAGKNEEVMV